MNREDFANVVAAVLGIHATEGRVDTIVVAADAYARDWLQKADEQKGTQ